MRRTEGEIESESEEMHEHVGIDDRQGGDRLYPPLSTPLKGNTTILDPKQ